MPDAKHDPRRARDPRQLGAVRRAAREWLLHEQVLAALQRAPPQLRVEIGGHGEDDRVAAIEELVRLRREGHIVR